MNAAPKAFSLAVDDVDRLTDLEAQKLFRQRAPLSAFAALRKGIAGFWTVYHKEKARREGVEGLFRAVNAGMFHFLTYAKHWELHNNARG